MKIEDIFCSEEQSVRLKELGIVQESLFYYTDSKWGIMPKKSIDFSGNPRSAFTIGELGFLLPKKIRKDRMDFTYRVNLNKSGNWEYKYRTRCNRQKGIYKSIPLILVTNKSEAQARADILIFLLENGHITAEFCNNIIKE